MMLQDPYAADCELFILLKELSGKLLERRRRRDHVTQRHLAHAVGRSDRCLREIEAGVPTSMLEDHIRCAHALRMTTPHLLIPLMAMEHKMAVPQELLMQDDLWDMEEDMLAVVARHQALAVSRLARRSGPSPTAER